LIGNFKNTGKIWCQTPEPVNVHDFPSEALGRAVPYGIYDRQHNQGTVYVGQSGDTPTFAVDNIATWCRTELPERFPNATELMIVADCGGSNSARSRVWKRDLGSSKVSVQVNGGSASELPIGNKEGALPPRIAAAQASVR
jgi:hypothetical protein